MCLSDGLWTSFVLSKQEKQILVLPINCTPCHVFIKSTAEPQWNYCYSDSSQWSSNKSVNKACIDFTDWPKWQVFCPLHGAIYSGFNLCLNAYAFLCSLSRIHYFCINIFLEMAQSGLLLINFYLINKPGTLYYLSLFFNESKMELANKDMYWAFKFILCCLHNSLLKPSTEHVILTKLLLILTNWDNPFFWRKQFNKIWHWTFCGLKYQFNEGIRKNEKLYLLN